MVDDGGGVKKRKEESISMTERNARANSFGGRERNRKYGGGSEERGRREDVGRSRTEDKRERETDKAGRAEIQESGRECVLWLQGKPDFLSASVPFFIFIFVFSPFSHFSSPFTEKGS